MLRLEPRAGGNSLRLSNCGFIFRPNLSLSPASLRFMEIVRDIVAEIAQREDALRESFL